MREVVFWRYMVLCDASVDFTHTHKYLRPEGPSRHDVLLVVRDDGVYRADCLFERHDGFDGVAGLGVDGLDGVD